MDIPAARALLDLSRRRRVLLFVAAGLAGYASYRFYHLPAVAERRRRISDLLRSLSSISHAFSQTADSISLVSSDLHRFLASDSDHIPNSLIQLSKLAGSDAFADVLSRVSEFVTVGVSRGARAASPTGTPGFAERLIETAISPAGTGFVSVVAGSFAKNLIMGFYNSEVDTSSDRERPPVPDWVRIACSDEVRRLMGECVERFVATAVDVYLKKTMDVNTYDEMFAGLTNPEHGEKMKEVLVSVCNGAVETLVKTSHEVLMGSKRSASVDHAGQAEEVVELPQDEVDEHAPGEDELSSGSGRWIEGVTSTLAIPSNRRFMLDVTGRVTFETIKSVLSFLFWNAYDSVRSAVTVVGSGIIESGLEVIRYVSAKSMLIVTVCFSMLLHLAFSSRLLVATSPSF